MKRTRTKMGRSNTEHQYQRMDQEVLTLMLGMLLL